LTVEDLTFTVSWPWPWPWIRSYGMLAS